MSRFFTLILLLSLPFLGQAQKYSNEFLTIGVGARAQAMGNSVVANSQDVTAAYWNPSGVMLVDSSVGLQIGAMHAEWFAGIGKYDFLGVVLPASNTNRRLAFSLIRFGIDGIPNTLSLFDDDGRVNYDNIVEFSAADYAFLGTYAQRIRLKNPNNTLVVGGNVKVIHRQIGSFATSWGFGLDVSAQYRTGNWRFGAIARDVTSTFNAWKITFTEEEKDVLLAEGNTLPDINSLELTRPQLLLGVGYAFQFGKISVYPEMDWYLTTDGQRNTLVSGDPISLDPSFGLEIGYNDLVYLRAGANQFQREINFDLEETMTVRPSIGIGLKLKSLMVDYAYTDLGDSQNRYSHVISLMLNLKPKK